MMNTRKDRNRLSLIITLWLFVFLICGMGAAYLSLPKQVESMVADQIGQRGLTLSEQVARNAIDGLVSEDPEEKRLILKKVLETLRSERQEFTACEITDEGQTIWASFNQAEVGKKYVSPVDQKGLDKEGARRYSSQAKGWVYNMAVPVILKSRRIGVIFGEVSLGKAYEDSQQVGNWILVAAAILFLIGAAGTMTIVATLPLAEGEPAPMSLARGGGADPRVVQEVEAKKEEAAKLTERIESLKDEELELVRRLELHQREMERVESGEGASPALMKEESEVTKRVEAKKREEQLLVSRIENLKKTTSEMASAPKPKHLLEKESEVVKRLEIKNKEEAELLKRIEAVKKTEADLVKRVESLRKEEVASASRVEELKKQGAGAEGVPSPQAEDLARQESELAQRIEAKRREEAALAAKIEEIRKKVLDLDRRIESRRREEIELAQRIEKRRQEAKEMESKSGGPGGGGS
jgi:hypothetical protein